MFKYGLGLFLNNLKNSERLGVSKESEMEVGVKPVTYSCLHSTDSEAETLGMIFFSFLFYIGV